MAGGRGVSQHAELFGQPGTAGGGAAAWLLLGQKDHALAAAKKSAESPPEQRNDLLAHFWHRNLAEVFLATGQAKLAIPHYEQAIQKTNIQG